MNQPLHFLFCGFKIWYGFMYFGLLNFLNIIINVLFDFSFDWKRKVTPNGISDLVILKRESVCFALLFLGYYLSEYGNKKNLMEW